MSTRNIPFGYTRVAGEIAPHPQEAAVVQEMFILYLRGLGFKAIAKELNNGPVPYHPGRPWNHNAVKRMLENPCYCGQRGFPPLVNVLMFQQAAAIKEAKPYSHQKRMPRQVDSHEYELMSYTPTAAVHRLTHDINRALERAPDIERIRPLIFACAAEKYHGIGVQRHG